MPPREYRLGSQFTPGVKLLLGILAATCLLGLFPPVHAFIVQFLLLRPSVAFWPMPWQLLTSPVIETDLFSLLFTGFLLYSMGSAVEQALGRRNFLRLLVLSSVLSAIFAAAVGFLIPSAREVSVVLHAGPIIMALLASFGRLYGDQPVVLWGIGQPVSGRGLSYFFIGLSLVISLWHREWVSMLAGGAGAVVGLVLGGRTRPQPITELRRLYRRLRTQIKRRRYKVLDGGLLNEKRPRQPQSEDKRWIN